MTLPITKLCLVIGDPIAHSLSPTMHNAAYAALEMPFFMAAARVAINDLPQALAGVRALGIHALSVTMPHKVSIIPLLDELHPDAREIGAVNTVVNRNGVLTGYNTDWLGILRPLEAQTSLLGKMIAILGAGGAAQAAAFAGRAGGAHIRVFNRSATKAQELATRWGCEAYGLDDNTRIKECDIVINTTPLGMGELASESPTQQKALRAEQIVFETIYSPHTTTLLLHAGECGANTVHGVEMFLEQGLAQFKLQTGSEPPREVMKKVIDASLIR